MKIRRAAFPISKSFCLIAYSICFSLAQPFPALAQSGAPAPLPPAAQEALNKGILAAKVPDYLLAIRYFEDARKFAPQAPIIYLNLGLAESRLPSRELRAMAWFGAYLAANPTAPNARAVKEQIDALDVKSQSNISRLIKTVQDVASQIPSSSERELRLTDVAGLWVRAGDISAALKVIGVMASPGFHPGFALSSFAEIQANSGDIAGARETAGAIEEALYKSKALMSVAAAQLEEGDAAAANGTLRLAQQTAGLIADTQKRGFTLGDVGELQAKTGDFAGALESIAMLSVSPFNGMEMAKDRALSRVVEAQAAAGAVADVRGSADAIQAKPAKDHAYGVIATAQAAAGDIAGAQKTADLMQEGLGKSLIQHPIGVAQVKAGDMAGALKTVHQIRDASNKRYVLDAILKEQIKARDFAAAMKTADLIPERQFIRHAQYDVFRAQREAGDIAGAQITGAAIQDAFFRVLVQTEIARAQAQRGDAAAAGSALAAAHASVETIPVEEEKDSALGNIARTQTSWGDLSGGLKTVERIRVKKNKDSALGGIARTQAGLGEVPGALKTIGLIQGEDERNASTLDIIAIQASAGDAVAALKTAELLDSAYWKGYGRLRVGEAQIRRGDMAGARKSFEEAQQAADAIQYSTPKHPKSNLLDAIAAAQFKTMPQGHTAGAASPWLKTLEDGDERKPCPLNTAPFLDLAEHLKSQPPSGDPKVVFNALHDTVKRIVIAQNVIGGMRKPQAKR